MDNESLQRKYQMLMNSYLHGKEEKKLYAAQQLSKMMLEQNVFPEELVSYHVTAMKGSGYDIPPYVLDSFQFLLEVIMGYGIAYREHLSLRHEQQKLTSEIEVAANMQQTLLPRRAPQIEGLDIGVLSVSAKQMSGDYYNFVSHGDHRFEIALADIAGKGIPAALCMSMIKYAIDSFYDEQLLPSGILRKLNNIVEHNIDPSMFITMVYGIYDAAHHTFVYSTAGHEPGFFYDAKSRTFRDLETGGLVLGVLRQVEYPEYRVTLLPGDAVILFSDGVTELRIEEQFMDRTQLKELILKHCNKKAQQLVEVIFDECLQLSQFELHDDHTMIVIRRSEE